MSAILLAAAICSAACDRPREPRELFVGSWRYTVGSSTLVMHAFGDGRLVVSLPDGRHGDGQGGEGRWAIDGAMLTLSQGEHVARATILRLDDAVLTYKTVEAERPTDVGKTSTWTRVE